MRFSATLRRHIPSPVKDALRPAYQGLGRAARHVLRTILALPRLVIGQRSFLNILQAISREIDTRIDVSGILFDGRHYIPYLRAVTLLTKEPDTIAWLDRVVEKDDVFYDIGANIGVYSLYAASKRGARVVAFEPFASNYSQLNRNIHLNGLGERITALCIAIHDRTTLSNLNVSEFWAGKAGHSFDAPVGSLGNVFQPKFKQGAIGLSVDEIIGQFNAPFPKHVKIDVDGNEALVIRGMKATLSDHRLKTIVVELNRQLPAHAVAEEMILEHGFALSHQSEALDATPTAEGHDILNYFYVRVATSEDAGPKNAMHSIDQ